MRLTKEELRVILKPLTQSMVLRAIASYLDGDKPDGFKELPKSYAIIICGQQLPVRPIVSIASRELSAVLTGEEMASDNTTVCKEWLEDLDFTIEYI